MAFPGAAHSTKTYVLVSWPLLQGKAPLHTDLIIAPPLRHLDDLTTAEDDENKEHRNVEARIKRRGDEVVVSLPGLEAAELDPDPFVQGLRPFREANVRVEREQRLNEDGSMSQIIHSYGQGG